MENATVCLGAIFDDARLAEIIATIFSRSKASKGKRLSAEARLKKAARQRAWNLANPERKRENDRRWAEKHGAQYMRRYRDQRGLK